MAVRFRGWENAPQPLKGLKRAALQLLARVMNNGRNEEHIFLQRCDDVFSSRRAVVKTPERVNRSMAFEAPLAICGMVRGGLFLGTGMQRNVRERSRG